MYAQNLSLVLRSEGVQLEWQILPGPFLADAVWAAADIDQSGSISTSEAEGWIEPFVSSLSAELDSLPLKHDGAKDVHWPASVDVMRTGEDRIRFALGFSLPPDVSGARLLQIHAAHLEANSLNWFAVAARGRPRIRAALAGQRQAGCSDAFRRLEPRRCHDLMEQRHAKPGRLRRGCLTVGCRQHRSLTERRDRGGARRRRHCHTDEPCEDSRSSRPSSSAARSCSRCSWEACMPSHRVTERRLWAPISLARRAGRGDAVFLGGHRHAHAHRLGGAARRW